MMRKMNEMSFGELAEMATLSYHGGSQDELMLALGEMQKRSEIQATIMAVKEHQFKTPLLSKVDDWCKHHVGAANAERAVTRCAQCNDKVVHDGLCNACSGYGGTSDD